MDKKTLWAVILSLVILLLWNVWYYNRYKDVIESNRVAAEQQAAPAETATAAPAGAAPAATTATGAAVDPTAGLTIQKAANEREITVDTGVSRIVLSNAGGVIRSLVLTGFTTDEGKPVDLVDPKAPLKPLALKFATSEATQKINETLFGTAAPDAITLSAENPAATVHFYLKLDNGVTVSKKLTFTHQSYRVGLETAVNVPGGNVTGSSFGLSWTGIGGLTDSYSYKGPVVLTDGKRMAEEPDEKETKVYETNVQWGGLVEKYYCAIMIPEGNKTKITTSKPYEGGYDVTMELPSNAGVNKLSLYAGPQNHVILDKEGQDLSRVINYGWFDIIANPLYIALLWIYTFIGNFGWAIIILTIVVKLIFWPMTQASFKSVEKMRKVQPQLKKIQDRYKNDKPKMNEEMINLYRTEKINPLSGCLPILLQIPVFVALYKVLLESIELKGAPFMLWITDLAAKDPYYVSPILMGISMFVQQKMSPAATDPIQRNIMLVLPVVFTVMFINFPAGLVIYWLLNNLLSILQQYLIRIQKEEK